MCHCQSIGCLRTNNSKRCFRNRLFLFLFTMRCMVGGNCLHRPVSKSATQLLYISRTPQRWVHFIIGIVTGNLILGHGKMVGTYFTGYLYTIFFGGTNHLHTVLRGAVAQMKPCTSLLRQQNISCHNHIFHRIGNPLYSQLICFAPGVHGTFSHHVPVFAMGHYRNICLHRLPHCLTVKFRIHHRFTIFADGFRTSLHHTGNIGHFFPHLPLCHGSYRVYMNRTILFGNFQNSANHLRAVGGRFRIRHGTDSRKTALRHRRRTSPYRLFVLKSGFSQMHMKIQKTRHHIFARRINNGDLFIRYSIRRKAADTGNLSILHV